MVFTLPFLRALIFWRFGCQVLLVLLLAWLTLFPKLGPLPQISHIRDMRVYPPVETEKKLIAYWNQARKKKISAGKNRD
jgi:hypothetical protein